MTTCLLSSLAATPSPDINGDGRITIADLTILGNHWQQTVPPGTLGDWTGPPNPVIHVTIVSSHSALVFWEDHAANADYYIISRSLDNATWTDVALIPAGTMTWLDLGLDASTTYWWTMRTCRDAGPLIGLPDGKVDLNDLVGLGLHWGE